MGNEAFRRKATTAANSSFELRGGRQTVPSGQHGRPERLRRKFGTALATAGGKNRTTCTGTHAKPETVGLGTTTIVGLEGTFAHDGLRKTLVYQGTNKGRRGAVN